MQTHQNIGNFEKFYFEISNDRKDAIEAVYALLNALKITPSQGDKSLKKQRRKKTTKKIFGALHNVSATDEDIKKAKALIGLK